MAHAGFWSERVGFDNRIEYWMWDSDELKKVEVFGKWNCHLLSEKTEGNGNQRFSSGCGMFDTD